MLPVDLRTTGVAARTFLNYYLRVGCVPSVCHEHGYLNILAPVRAWRPVTQGAACCMLKYTGI